jgi:nitrite reductase/ring-hydroxylating ferredoxin subunit
VLGLHIAAFVKEWRVDVAHRAAEGDGYLKVCDLSDLREGWGRAVKLRYDRVAVYLHEGRVFALSNACRHQAGPIGEGKLVDGAVTCPWHGWNYRLDDGVSPPPFHEVLPTYPVRVAGRSVYVHPDAYSLETRTTGAPITGGASKIVLAEARA